jgi:hypothetical protein
MAAKAVNARKRSNRNDRSRGHGPLLQKRGPFRRRMVRFGAADSCPTSYLFPAQASE